MNRERSADRRGFYAHCAARFGREQSVFITECVKKVEKSDRGFGVQRIFYPPDPLSNPNLERSSYYLRKVFVWDPFKQFPESIVPNTICPKCFCYSKIWYQGKKRARQILDTDDYFILVYKQFKCQKCNGYSTNVDMDMLKLLPEVVLAGFPIILSHNYGFTINLKAEIELWGARLDDRNVTDVLSQRYINRYERIRKLYLAHSNKEDFKTVTSREPLATKVREANGEEEDPLSIARTKKEIEWLKKWKLVQHFAKSEISNKKRDRLGRSLNTMKLPVIGETKARDLSNVHERVFLVQPEVSSQFLYLTQFQDTGITTVLELANFPIEKYENQDENKESALIRELCILTNNKWSLKMKKATRKQIHDLAKRWVESARAVLVENAKMPIEEINDWANRPMLPPEEELTEEEIQAVTGPPPSEAAGEPEDFGAYDDKSGYRGFQFSNSFVGHITAGDFDLKPVDQQRLADDDDSDGEMVDYA